MNNLNDFAKEINKCSKCGLCQSVCPLYKLTGNDCAVSKGKFVMLDGVVKGDLRLNKTINKYLDMCLKCGKCSDFCPSGINVCEIFASAKHEYLKSAFEGLLVKAIYSKFMFDFGLKIFDTFHKNDNSILKSVSEKSILFFRGCADKIYSADEKAFKTVISNLPYQIFEPDFKCCGVPFVSSGYLEKAEYAKKYNTQKINSSDCDLVVTDCASCQYSLESYGTLNKRVLSSVEFFAEEHIKFEFDKKYRVTFHKPCHLKNYDAVKEVLANCKNVEYVEMEGFDDCCGFSGQFAITNQKLSRDISRQKIEKALAVEPDIILTSCPACILGLYQGLFASKGIVNTPKIMNITAFLGMAQFVLKK